MVFQGYVLYLMYFLQVAKLLPFSNLYYYSRRDWYLIEISFFLFFFRFTYVAPSVLEEMQSVDFRPRLDLTSKPFSKNPSLTTKNVKTQDDLPFSFDLLRLSSNWHVCMISDGTGIRNSGSRYPQCHGEMGFFIFCQTFDIFDDFSKWSAQKTQGNFEQSSKIWFKKWRKALYTFLALISGRKNPIPGTRSWSMSI